MNVKQLIEKLQELDFAGNGNTAVEVQTKSGSVKQIETVGFSAITGAIAIYVK